MAPYIYQKYNAQYNAGGYRTVITGNSSFTRSGSLSGYASWYVSGNQFIGSGGIITIPLSGSGTVHHVWTDSVVSETANGSSVTQTNYALQYESDSYTRGSLIGQVIAEDGTLPENGRHTDGFFYVRRAPAAPPILTSPNGGESWNEIHMVQWTASRPGLKYRVELSTNNGQSWAIIDPVTPLDARYTIINFTNELQTSSAKVRVTGIDGDLFTLSDESDGVFTIAHNVAPFAPTNLTPSGTVVDRLKTNRFSWQHNDSPNDSQTRADIQWRQQGSSTWNELTFNGQEQGYFISQNTLPSGQIEWRVRTYDGMSLVSPWSSVAVFTAAEPTNIPTIIQPLAVVPVSRPVIEWASTSQSSYQIVIEDSLGTVVWDTGEVVSTVRARTVGVDLLNGGTYKLKVRVKDSGGLFSSFVDMTFAVRYTPPAIPRINVTGEGHFITVGIENPEPTGTQPNVKGNEVHRRLVGESRWLRIADGMPSNSTYEDYATASGKQYEYKVVALADTGSVSESAAAEGGVKFMGVYLHSVQDPAMTSHRYQFDGSGRSSSKQAEHAFRRFAGRKKQTVEYGEMVDYAVSASIQILREDDGAERLEQFVENMETVCYRDGRGRLLFGVITAAPLEDVSYGWETTIDVTEIDYSEEV